MPRWLRIAALATAIRVAVVEALCGPFQKHRRQWTECIVGHEIVDNLSSIAVGFDRTMHFVVPVRNDQSKLTWAALDLAPRLTFTMPG